MTRRRLLLLTAAVLIGITVRAEHVQASLAGVAFSNPVGKVKHHRIRP